jgi:hypothetical protein
MDAAQAANMIRNSGQWKPGMPVKLMACEVAKGENNFARDLATNLNASVTGPNSLLVARPTFQGGFVLEPYMWSWGGFRGAPGRFVTYP